jgi:zinc protease
MRTLTRLAVGPLALAFGAAGIYAMGGGVSEPPVSEAGRLASDTPAIIALHEPESPFIAFNIWVKSGAVADPKGKEGLASMTASLVAGGATKQDSLEQILEKLYPLAASYSVSVDKEMTNFVGRVHRDNLEAFYALFRNALMAPAFAEADFTRIKAQRMNYLERGRRYSRDEELSKQLLFWMAYEGTPYQHPEEGYVESVRGITLEDVRAFHREHYVRNNIVVGVGGGYPDGFPARVRKDIDGLPEGTVRAVAAPAAGRRRASRSSSWTRKPTHRPCRSAIRLGCCATSRTSCRCWWPTPTSASTATRSGGCTRRSARRAG